MSTSLLFWAATSSVATSSTVALEAEFAAALAAPPPPTTAPPSIRLIDVSLDLLAAVGGSTEKEANIRELQAGGHDPKNRGFTIQNVELSLSGVVDPYFRGDAHVILQIDFAGETAIELEEAYLTSLALPFNLQLKAGHFFTAFGRLNPMHPHAWDFVDQPVISSRLLGGDGLRNPGAQIAWLTPLPFFFELVFSVQNSQGETAASFRSAPGEEVGGHVLIERDVDHLRDLLYLARAEASFDPTDELTFVLGTSGAYGPNASGEETSTIIGGADLYVKWKPLANEVGWPFVALQAEGMWRRYEVPGGALHDYGLYAQALWGITRPWVIGARYDLALDDTRHRAAGVITYHPTEFSKVRAQYSYDRAAFLPTGDSHSAYLQLEITFGAHGAHQF